MKSTAPATVPRLRISLIKENGMTPRWKTYSKALSSSLSIRKPDSLESLYSALRMIPSRPRQSLRHGLCTRLKMRISTSPTSRGKQGYGHQDVAVMLSCNGIILNYAIVMYGKPRSKLEIVQDIADGLPVPPVVPYFLCDSWYFNKRVWAVAF